MMDYLADTVALIRHMERHPALGRRAKRIFQEADVGEHRIYISAMTLMEILYLADARKIKLNLPEVIVAIRQSDNYLIHPINTDAVVTAMGIDDVPELHDRIIAGTAKHLNTPILTSDQNLAKSRHITTIWL